MTTVRLRIDHIAVEVTEQARAGEVESTLRTALSLLASRLTNLPLAGHREGSRKALEMVELGPVDPEWLAGPGAAARLADDLYRQIARSVS